MQLSIYDALAELDKPKPKKQLSFFDIEEPPPAPIDLIKTNQPIVKPINEINEPDLVFKEEMKGDKFFCIVSIFKVQDKFYSEVSSRFSNEQGSSWNLKKA